MRCCEVGLSEYHARICSGHKYPFSVKLWGYRRLFFRLFGGYKLCDRSLSYLRWSFL